MKTPKVFTKTISDIYRDPGVGTAWQRTPRTSLEDFEHPKKFRRKKRYHGKKTKN